jgi:hypothetical protein
MNITYPFLIVARAFFSLTYFFKDIFAESAESDRRHAFRLLQNRRGKCPFFDSIDEFIESARSRQSSTSIFFIPIFM